MRMVWGVAPLGAVGLAAGLVARLTGCGGGSSGGGSSIYKGLETPAVISAGNAAALARDVGSAIHYPFPIVDYLLKPQGHFAPGRLHRTLRGLAKPGDGARQSVKVDQDCPGGGHRTNEMPSLTDTVGVFRVTYFGCDMGDGFKIDGSVADVLATSTGTNEVGHVQMNLAVASDTESFQFQAAADYSLNGATLRDHTAGDFAFWDVNRDLGARLRGVDLTAGFADVDAWNGDCAAFDDYRMTVFDSFFGSVDVRTASPVQYAGSECLNPGPSSGGPIVLTGAGGGTISLAPFTATLATVALDADGDGTPELVAQPAWADLGFL